MAVFVSLGRQRLPFVKCALAVDTNAEDVRKNIKIYRKNKIRIIRFASYENPNYKYIWTVYSYIGKEDNFAKAIQEIQKNFLICGYSDYNKEASKMIAEMSKLAGNLSVRQFP